MICDETAGVTRPAVVGFARIDIGQWISPGGAESQLTLCKASAIGKLVPTQCMCMSLSTVEERSLAFHCVRSGVSLTQSGHPQNHWQPLLHLVPGYCLSRHFRDKGEILLCTKSIAVLRYFKPAFCLVVKGTATICSVWLMIPFQAGGWSAVHCWDMIWAPRGPFGSAVLFRTLCSKGNGLVSCCCRTSLGAIVRLDPVLRGI